MGMIREHVGNTAAVLNQTQSEWLLLFCLTMVYY